MEPTFSYWFSHAGFMGTVMVMRFVLVTMAAVGLGYGVVYTLNKVLTRTKK